MINLFRLDSDIDRPGTVHAVREGVEFQGTNVWSLIFAILVASIGLNVNSPAVIIGAMLISPLMGPITGAGVGLAIYDLALLRRALLNLALMTGISLVASALYFWLTPLNGVTSELLARTKPTFYDVLIAAVGGSALMVGLSRKVRSGNMLAGVAIATALMPPLCTAGFGLATRNFGIFAGAFYLYLINSVIIGLTTYLFGKLLKLHRPAEGEPEKALRRRHIVLTIVAVVVFLTPSLIVAYNVVKDAEWSGNLARFEREALVFPDSQVIESKVVQVNGQKTLEIALVGAPLSDDLKSHLEGQLPRFGLEDMKLKFIQNASGAVPSAALPAPAAAAVPQTAVRDERPAKTAADLPLAEVTREAEILFPSLAHLVWGPMDAPQDDQDSPMPTAFARWTGAATPAERARLEAFLRLRIDQPYLKVVHETLPKE